MKRYIYFLASFFKIGCIGFGGGSALIPVIEEEVVNRQGIDTKENLDRDVLVANLTPGALPVELAASIGRRTFGIPGMLTAPAAMALPGALATIFLLTFLAGAQADILANVEIASVGVAVFITYLLLEYIGKMLKECKKESTGRLYKALFVMFAVFLLVCEKNLYQILGIERVPFFSVATIHILAVAFFCVLYSRSHYNRKTIAVMTLLSGGYLLANGKMQLLHNPYLLHGIEISMLVLAVRGIILEVRESRGRKNGRIGADILREPMVWGILLLTACIPISCLCVESLSYFARGILSSLMSFGGGDAYLTIADGMFVESGMITAKQYYGQLVPVVNVLPGSILCKVLPGIGYYVGVNSQYGSWSGWLVAFGGFICGIASSCGFYMLVYGLQERLSGFHVFQVIGRWIRPMIAGLLLNVMLSLLSQSLEVTGTYGMTAGSRLMVYFAMLVGDVLLIKKFHVFPVLVIMVNFAVLFVGCMR